MSGRAEVLEGSYDPFVVIWMKAGPRLGITIFEKGVNGLIPFLLGELRISRLNRRSGGASLSG